MMTVIEAAKMYEEACDEANRQLTNGSITRRECVTRMDRAWSKALASVDDENQLCAYYEARHAIDCHE